MRKIAIMVNCGELRITLVSLDTTFTGQTITNNNQNVIILNSNFTYEYNLKKLLHEMQHLEHISSRLSVEECERKSIKLENNPVALSRLVNFID